MPVPHCGTFSPPPISFPPAQAWSTGIWHLLSLPARGALRGGVLCAVAGLGSALRDLALRTTHASLSSSAKLLARSRALVLALCPLEVAATMGSGLEARWRLPLRRIGGPVGGGGAVAATAAWSRGPAGAAGSGGGSLPWSEQGTAVLPRSGRSRGIPDVGGVVVLLGAGYRVWWALVRQRRSSSAGWRGVVATIPSAMVSFELAWRRCCVLGHTGPTIVMVLMRSGL